MRFGSAKGMLFLDREKKTRTVERRGEDGRLEKIEVNVAVRLKKSMMKYEPAWVT